MADEEKAPGRAKRANSVSVDSRAAIRQGAAPDATAPNPEERRGEPASGRSGKSDAERPLSIDPGDVPDGVRKRYYSQKSRWSGEPAFYTSAQTKDPAFRDQGRRLVTATESQEVVKDLVAIAQHRGWDRVHVTGSESFRRAAWLEASQKGLEVRGYKPNERDLQELDRLQGEASRNSIAPAAGRDGAAPRGGSEKAVSSKANGKDLGDVRRVDVRTGPNEKAADSQLRVIEAVIRRTLFENPEGVDRVMSVARAQFDAHIAAGRTIKPAVVRDTERSKAMEVTQPAGRGRTPPAAPGREPKPQDRVRAR
ncbi:hypothetical protein SAMN05518849_11457 [Sphingobium sp. AP50]|uniref:LPD7 domain-containing protein n=1 Tax=Sphingobium sp. AP50 TaxID=1884369 RepID=UPI0008B8CC71|nr:LPD7 domain-containing protein [Sphingobium sp. AP50]SEJ80939.1 hypothetical protein SAMN05518849_11457 [Sphingobium sp. AP50]